MAPVSLFCILFFSHLVLLCSAEEEERQPKNCPSFPCGKFETIDFPFSHTKNPDCGLFVVDCTEPNPKIQLEKGGKWYEVTSISQGGTIIIRDQVLIDHLRSRNCSSFNLTLPSSSFFSIFTPNLTLFQCNRSLNFTPPPTDFNYTQCNDKYNIYYNDPNHILPSFPPQCSIIQLPLKKEYLQTNSADLFSLLAEDISLGVQVSQDCYQCNLNGGQCIDINRKFQCANATKASVAGNKKLGLKLALGASVAGMGVLMLIVCCFRRKFSSNKYVVFWKKETQNHQNVEVFLRNNGSLAPKRYSYSDVKKMTYSFKNKLGQGGYGSVYKGKLHDGRFVAVKVLNKSKGDGQEFVNEVASISRTSHVNIVTLLGFCFEGSKRALIYEFMPNGSLEKFIYDENKSRANPQLGWETLYQIAISIARGLDYLHRGCNTRILHFDIKPHNILLDEVFCPKISDFGLSKLCPKNESIISMMVARGTPGYIAPEVFCRNFGGVSHKSDVYSYGMMVLEMVGGRKNIDVGVDQTSEIYFPHWIYKRLEQGDQLGLHGFMNEEESEKARKMILVGLCCIQNDPANRPPMGTVVEMLQGSLGSLQIPPRP